MKSVKHRHIRALAGGLQIEKANRTVVALWYWWGVNMANIILRLPTVKVRTGLSRSSIYLIMSDGEFPVSISLGGRAVGSLKSDIENWLDEKILSSQSAEQ